MITKSASVGRLKVSRTMSTLNAMIPSQESLAGKEKENLKIIRKIWQ
jgi:hypothetical protein